VARPPVEVADIFNAHGAAWRENNAGHVSLGQRKAMSAIERCRTEVLGGHVLHCVQCDDQLISYNSCRNRHCPKCCGSKAEQWLSDRKTELLDVEYYHVVFTLPAEIGHIAYQNKAVIYDLLFKAAAETLTTIAADPRHLGAKIGFTAVLHTWGSALAHHPHIHCIVPGGGLSADGERWIPSKRGFFLPVRVLSRLFRRLFLDRFLQAHDQLQYFGDLQPLADPEALRDYLAPLRTIDWVVYAKRPFAGPEAVLTYLSRYTHRVAISNHRLICYDECTVTFQVKDYRKKHRVRYQPMTLSADEFIRRFLLHVLPSGFHRIRHYGLFASPSRRDNLARIRELLHTQTEPTDKTTEPAAPADQPCTFVCRVCGEPLRIIEILTPKTRAPP
jgi:hypothetical protein